MGINVANPPRTLISLTFYERGELILSLCSVGFLGSHPHSQGQDKVPSRAKPSLGWVTCSLREHRRQRSRTPATPANRGYYLLHHFTGFSNLNFSFSQDFYLLRLFNILFVCFETRPLMPLTLFLPTPVPTGLLDVWYRQQDVDSQRQNISLFWKVSH